MNGGLGSNQQYKFGASNDRGRQRDATSAQLLKKGSMFQLMELFMDEVSSQVLEEEKIKEKSKQQANLKKLRAEKAAAAASKSENKNK